MSPSMRIAESLGREGSVVSREFIDAAVAVLRASRRKREADERKLSLPFETSSSEQRAG